jgi:hypothetical protein
LISIDENQYDAFHGKRQAGQAAEIDSMDFFWQNKLQPFQNSSPCLLL